MKKTICAAAAIAALAVPSAAVAKAPEGGWGQYGGVWRGHEAALNLPDGTLAAGGYGQAVSSQEPGAMGSHASGGTASPGN